jgi:CheY-like chemotaxis protein
VTTVSSGAEALAILSNPCGAARPDILICDIAMPVDGRDRQHRGDVKSGAGVQLATAVVNSEWLKLSIQEL